MAKPKNKNFRDWMEQDEWGDSEPRSVKKDGKRYDKKKSNIRNARKAKAKNKFSHLD